MTGRADALCARVSRGLVSRLRSAFDKDCGQYGHGFPSRRIRLPDTLPAILSKAARAGRALLVHGGDHEEWGFGALVRLDPGAEGRGPSLSLVPAWARPRAVCSGCGATA